MCINTIKLITSNISYLNKYATLTLYSQLLVLQIVNICMYKINKINTINT